MIEWLAQSNPAVQTAKVIAGAVVAVAALGAAYATFGVRLAQAEAAEIAHDGQLAAHERRIGALEQSRSDDRWTLYVICRGLATRGLVDPTDCRQPPER